MSPLISGCPVSFVLVHKLITDDTPRIMNALGSGNLEHSAHRFLPSANSLVPKFQKAALFQDTTSAPNPLDNNVQLDPALNDDVTVAGKVDIWRFRKKK
jgi:hypothetical protein